MTVNIKSHFPSSKEKWKKYLVIFMPIFLGSLLFSINGIIDNFMVGQIEQGITSLGAANSWTNILNGFFLGSAMSGAGILAQFYSSNDESRSKQIARLRYLTTMFFALWFAFFAIVIPSQMISLFLKAPLEGKFETDSHYQEALASHKVAIDNAVLYMRINAVQWILSAITFNLGVQLREIGHGRAALYWAFATVASNMTFNSIFMYGIGMGVEGAAYASIISRVVELAIGITYIIKKKLMIAFRPQTLFQISKEVYIIYFKRWFNLLASASITFFITFRNYFYDIGYPSESLGKGVRGVTVLGLAGAINTVFASSFTALGAMSANFVASHLGRGEIEQAKINANELKGFNSLVISGMSIILVIFATILPYMTFMSKSSENFDGVAHLKQVKNALYVLAFMYPFWTWFRTSIRNMLAGGKGSAANLADWIIAGPFQLAYLALEMTVIIAAWPFMQHNFWVGYAIFYLTDFIKLIVIEIIYYKTNWAHSIVKEEVLDEHTSPLPIDFDESTSS